MSLDPAFLQNPLAHRGLHDLAANAPENSPEAFRQAVAQGYGIELDIQVSADDVPMVFHDPVLDRLTAGSGPIRGRTAAELGQITLKGGHDTIPTLAGILALVNGRVPLLIEIKDQDGGLGPDTGMLDHAVARCLQGYDGSVAVMSFNPNTMAEFHAAAPNIPVGLITTDFTAKFWGFLPEVRRKALTSMTDIDRVGASFISHNWAHLSMPSVAEVKSRGLPVLCWTIRSHAAEIQARKIADNITFEGYLA